MKLNVKKSKVRWAVPILHQEGILLEIKNETKLLGTIISTDLKWHANSEMLVKKAYLRMIILRKTLLIEC